MTVLNFMLQPEFLHLVTDTLCTVGAAQRPYIYSSKIHLVPHLHGAVTSMGQGLFGLECMKALMVRLIARDMTEADPDVPELYRELWAKHLEILRANGDEIASAKATVCHFGWVASEQRIVGYEYAVENGFASTRIQDGCWLHPNTVDILIRHPDDLVRIAKKQRKIDDQQPDGKRAGIGGDLHRLELTREGAMIQRVFRWDDFDKVFQIMEEASRGESGSADTLPGNVHSVKTTP